MVSKNKTAAFPIVGIGASAGGLEAFEQFFSHLPVNSGMAFVLVQHLDPGHVSLLTEILQRTTTIPVTEAVDKILVKPNHVYVIPPGKCLSTSSGLLMAIKLAPHKGTHVTVDCFFRLLAESHGTAAVAVVLSGRKGDGAAGVKSIKEHGGLTIAQDPAEAEQPGMPQAATHEANRRRFPSPEQGREASHAANRRRPRRTRRSVSAC